MDDLTTSTNGNDQYNTERDDSSLSFFPSGKKTGLSVRGVEAMAARP